MDPRNSLEDTADRVADPPICRRHTTALSPKFIVDAIQNALGKSEKDKEEWNRFILVFGKLKIKIYSLKSLGMFYLR